MTSHDSTSPDTPSRDSTTDIQDLIQDQGKELSRPSESTDIAQLEPSISTSSDSPIISNPSSTSSSTPDSVQAINDTPQQSHMFNDSTIASTTTTSSSSVYILSRPANALGTTGSASRSSQPIVTPISSPSLFIQPSASHPPPPHVNLPLPPANAHTGESIYRTIMNRLSALEANTTLYARYVEEQTNAMREMLRRLNEDVGRLEGIGRAQAQMYARSISDFEKHRREMDNEQRTLISQVNYLAEEVSLFLESF